MEQLYEVKVFLRSCKKPLQLCRVTKTIYEQLYTDLMTKDVIKIGPLIFRRDDFIYASIE